MKLAARGALEAAGVDASLVRALSSAAVDENGVAEVALPARWERLGDLVLFAPRGIFDDSSECGHALQALEPGARAALLRAIAAALPPSGAVRRIGVQGRIEPSEHRKSGARLLWPDGPADGWTTHWENKIAFSLDVTRSMFASGNGSERMRVAKLDCAGETVVDLYAGIGYFTLPLLLHAGAAHLHACEWDADALRALRHNLGANRVAKRCTVHAGDCRESVGAFAGTAHRVNLGLIPSSEGGWRVALQALRPEGGWLHVHANVVSAEAAAWRAHLYSSLAAHAAELGRRDRFSIAHIEKVKNYAPGVRHVVADVHVVGAAALHRQHTSTS